MTDPWIGRTEYAASCRPKLADLLESLGLDVVYTRARGAYLYREGADGTERRVLDLVGGFGAGLLGHNHPELTQLLKDKLDAGVPFLAQSSQRREAGRLAARLSELMPGNGRYLAQFTNSGAEAIEAALKHAYLVRFDRVRRQFEQVSRKIEAFFQKAEREYPDIEIPGHQQDLGTFRDDLDEHNLAQFERFQNNPVVLAFKGSFHGKTASALKVTFNRTYREGFEGLSAIRSRFLDFADATRLSEIQREYRVAFRQPGIANGRIIIDTVEATTIIALCLEIIQGEGGIRLVPADTLEALAAQHDRLGIPYLIDEIQTGCGRTGSFVAYGATPLGAIQPEYVTLSKALGGGLVKIGAALIRHDVYDQNFGILHASTFAEDEVSSIVAGRVLEILTRHDNAFMTDIAAKGAYFLSGLRALGNRFPGIIRDVRGRGLMIGVEFADLEDKSPLFRFGVRQGFLALLVASYLLHHHDIRTLAPLTTLLKGNPGKRRLCILRIQPPAAITQDEIDRVVRALEEVCRVIDRNHEGALVAHLLGVTLPGALRRDPPVAPVRYPPSRKRVDFDARVGFVVHPAHVDQLLDYYFPTLQGLVERKRLAIWWSRLARFLEADVIHTDYVRSEGFVVEANVVSVPFLPRHLVEVQTRAVGMPNPDRLDLLRLEEIRDKIQDAVTTARELGDDHIPTAMVGLGAYTSIVTDRGKTVNDYEVPVTTGNAYTAGLMVQGIRKAADLKGLPLAQARAAVVGAAGNIGSVLAALLSGHVGTLKLVGRDTRDGLDRLRQTRRQCLLYLARKARAHVEQGASLDELAVGGVGDRILREIMVPALAGGAAPRPSGSWRRADEWLHGADHDLVLLGDRIEAAIDRDGGMEGNDYITIHLSVDAVKDCDVITIATNSPEAQLITPALVKPGAVVSCASVPSNLSAAFEGHLRDYLVFDGGFARLPEGHEIDCVGLPRNGLAFGCLSETLLLGFDGRNSSFARGRIMPEQVEETLRLAELYGFTLGEFKLNETPYPAEYLAAGGNGRHP
ncbi:MAG TPA: aminotransferase class III-fold pyridoxal phosphate-dependent enzyme [Gemmatimonadales bacterium]